ncbi:MAG: succinylglutamate desuccinylase/aspartoacylase family protein [Bdellovibrionaceae bacterium]|nr:succinylglutamate desuccinylase/aspartoacylase family protein [Bdellovibrionales bacterium]MCB9085640.1 succinylglutamate desuccinylase/aspartoacylase family protein [Pseudobdellovibrionaceae bacterium]
MELNILRDLPDVLLTCRPDELFGEFGGPILLEIGHQDCPPLFVSTLLHGNETTGFFALQRLFAEYRHHPERFHRPLIVLFGNVEAASKGLRRRDDQLDYNRVWAGGTSPEHQWAQEILHYIKNRQIFAGLDIHNNTGRNPMYGCVNFLNEKLIYMASLFSPHIVYFQKPDGVLSKAMAQFATGITIECGLPGVPEGIDQVYDYLLTLLHLETMQEIHPGSQGVNVYHSRNRLMIPDSFSLAREESPDSAQADFVLPKEFDQWNFSELKSDALIMRRNNPHGFLIVQNENGDHVQDDYLEFSGCEVRLKQPTIPSMFTRDVAVAKQDCLGYLMDRLK